MVEWLPVLLNTWVIFTYCNEMCYVGLNNELMQACLIHLRAMHIRVECKKIFWKSQKVWFSNPGKWSKTF